MTGTRTRNHRFRLGRHALGRRIARAAIRRFVFAAQRGLARDGPANVRRARRMVAMFARRERARGAANSEGNDSPTELPATLPNTPHYQLTTLISPLMNLIHLPGLKHRKHTNNGHGSRSVVPLTARTERDATP